VERSGIEESVSGKIRFLRLPGQQPSAQEGFIISSPT